MTQRKYDKTKERIKNGRQSSGSCKRFQTSGIHQACEASQHHQVHQTRKTSRSPESQRAFREERGGSGSPTMAKSAAAGDRDSRSMEIFSADTVIVGAGASGLAAAVAASRQGSRVIVAEEMKIPGKSYTPRETEDVIFRICAVLPSVLTGRKISLWRVFSGVSAWKRRLAFFSRRA